MMILERILTRTTQAALSFWVWLSSRPLDPRDWDTVTWLSAVIVLLSVWIVALLASHSARAPKRSKGPDLMVSKGTVRQREGGTAQILSIKVSNLNDFSVQLLEITLKSELMTTPLIIDAAELLHAGEAVELEAPLPSMMSGDEGVIDVFAFVPRSKKLYCLSAGFVWEAWAFRYKISPLGQSVKRVKRLESTKLSRLRKRAWFERRSSPAARAFDEVVDTSYKAPEPEAILEPAPEPDDIMQLLEAKPQPSTLVDIPQPEQVNTLKPHPAASDAVKPNTAQPDSRTSAVPLRAPQSRSEPRREFPKDF